MTIAAVDVAAIDAATSNGTQCDAAKTIGARISAAGIQYAVADVTGGARR